MRVKLDNYEISSEDGKYFKVNLDGQNIIHKKGNCTSKSAMVLLAVSEIQIYNERHGLAWGELE